VYKGSFELIRQEQVSYGDPVAEALPALLPKTDEARVIVVTARSLADAPETRALIDALGPACALHFFAVREHAPFSSIAELIAAIGEIRPDDILVIGGGSAIDTTKVALICSAAGITDPADMPDFAARTLSGALDDLEFPCRYTVVPTTLSGAEFGVIGAGVDEKTRIKTGFRSKWFPARHVHYDPYLARRTPEWLWLSTGVRAIDHAVETILSANPNTYASALAAEALPLLFASLEKTKADPEDLEARQNAQFGVWLAAIGIGRVPYGASHGIGHQLGAVSGVAHGHTSCVLLPAVMEYNAEVVGDRFGPIASALGCANADEAPEALRGFLRRIGMPTTLKEVNTDPADYEKIAELSLANLFVKANPRPITEAAQVMEILNRASG